MLDKTYDRVSDHPKFAELVAKRNRFSLLLSFIVLGVYYTYVTIAAVYPAIFASPVSEGLVWPLGLALGFAIQMFAFLMTGVYVRRANGEFDDISRDLISETAR